MREKVLQKIVIVLSENLSDTLLTGIEECPKEFPYTIAVINFMTELMEKNIIIDYYQLFDGTIIDMVNRETTNYLAR